MKNTQPPITLDEAIYLRKKLEEIYFPNDDRKVVYDSKEVKQFLDIINSKRVGIPKGTSPKQIGIKLEEWFEILNQAQTNTTEIPQYEAQTTTTGLDLETKIEEADRRAKQKADIQSREKQTIDDFIKNYQERIKEVQSTQAEFKDKVVYAKVVVDPKDVVKLEQLEPNTQEKIKHYETLIKQEKFETAKQELAAEIERNAEKELLRQGVTKEDIKTIARETANEAIEVLSHKDDVIYTPPSYQTVILATVATDSKVLPTVIKSKSAEELIKLSANNVSVFRIQPEILTRSVLVTAFGEQFSTVVLGVDPTKIRVTLTETLPQNITQTQYGEYREVHLAEVNNHQIDIYQGQINVLNRISESGRGMATNYVQNSVTGFLSRKIEALPVGVIKKITSTPEMQAVLFAKFGMGNPVTWQYTNPILMRVMGQNQIAGAVFSKVFGDKIVVPVTTKVVAGQVASKVATQVAVKKGFGAIIGKVIGFFAGTPAGPAGWIAGLAIGEVAGRAIQNIWSKVKIWLKENKDIAAPAVGVVSAFFIAPFFGAGPAVLGGVGAFALFGGSVAGLATGAFGVLGLIGRSTLITISTPVIVTLLVLPPLVAFIMLVINNSAYIVPPSPYSSSQNSGTDNPYMLVTKTANPTKLDNSNSNQTVIYVVTVKALKGNLTNVNITGSECTVTKKDNSNTPDCPPEIFPEIVNESISPNEPHTFSFTGIYNEDFSDSLIYDSITFTATAEDGTEVTTSGSASVCIGDCPHGCFEISNDNEDWPQNYVSTLSAAVSELTSKFPQFVDKACIGRPSVKLCYTTKDPSPIGTKGLCKNAIYAITSELSDSNNGCVINFNQCGVKGNSSDAFFLLTHEISHHISWRDGGEMINNYLNRGAQHELPLCSYSGTKGDPYEGSAEANALYANGGTASFSTCSMNFQSQYPKNYGYAQEYMNKP